MEIVHETARTRLRITTPDDVEFLVGLYGHPEVMRYVGGPRDPDTVRAELERFFAEDVGDPIEMWTLVERDTDRPIGDCGLVRKEVDGASEVEMVYLLHPDWWGRGIGTEVASGIRDHAIVRLRQRRLVALVDPENAASCRIAQKIGMRYEKDTVRPSGAPRRVYAIP